MSPLNTDGALRWAVRESFLRYVTVIARGTVETDGVDTDATGRFVFPLRARRLTDDGWHLSFSGSVRFTAHNGFLDVLIAAPEVIVSASGGVLATHVAEDPQSLLPLLEIAPIEPETRADGLHWDAVPTLLRDDAVTHFGSVYASGAEMAPLSITAALLHS
ncbi:HtaA domain-containing protein [Microbacterium sp. Leaf159]|uniref:HtaA domain-containing protein n=1 Tax=Microbacterium sp. Leaf159 TaxID=1736279 RepID=UPI0006F5BEFA|nr:HtaA domain-containing protein [Microbacterium sp. Leaf159]KQR37448.1 hypothetical protein ASF80_16975 [Microbacterium sp. Leaf159]